MRFFYYFVNSYLLIGVSLIFYFLFQTSFSHCISPYREQYVPKSFKSPLVKYNSNWLETVRSSDFHPKAFHNCHQCSFPVRNNNSNSKENDLITGVMIESIEGFIPFVRTLRSTGSLATLVIFIDHRAFRRFTPNHSKQIENCAVLFYNIGRIPFTQDYLSFYIPVIDYIIIQQQYIDRVLFLDIYDIVFQGDPFTDQIENNTLYFISQMYTYEQNPKMRTLHIFNLTHEPKYLKLPVINAGHFYGDVNVMLQFFDLVVKTHEKLIKDNFSYENNDQEVVNYIYITGQLEAHNITYQLDSPTSSGAVVVVIGFWENDHNETFGWNIIAQNSKVFSKFVHKYDAYPNMLQSVFNSCPQGIYSVPDFIRKISYLSQFKFRLALMRGRRMI